MPAIQEAIRSLDTHSGSAMVVLTLAYAIMTLLILREIRRTNKIAQDLERARNRPFVVFYVESRDRCFHAILKNFGPQPAFDVRTIIEPGIMRRGEPDNQLSVTKSVVPMLAPGMHIDDFIEVTHTYLQRSADTCHKVTVQYKDTLGTEYSERGIVSVEHYRNRITTHIDRAEDKIAMTLGGVERTLQDLARSRYVTMERQKWLRKVFR